MSEDGVEFYQGKPRFVYCGIYENHVTVMDTKLDTLVSVWFSGDQSFCDWCERTDCEHVEYVLSLPKIVEKLKENGWVIKNEKTAVRKSFFI